MSQLIQIIMNIPIAIAISILVVVLAAVIGPCGSLILVTIKQFNRLLSTIPWPNALHSFLYRPFLIVSNTPLVALPSIPINFFHFGHNGIQDHGIGHHVGMDCSTTMLHLCISLV